MSERFQFRFKPDLDSGHFTISPDHHFIILLDNQTVFRCPSTEIETIPWYWRLFYRIMYGDDVTHYLDIWGDSYLQQLIESGEEPNLVWGIVTDDDDGEDGFIFELD